MVLAVEISAAVIALGLIIAASFDVFWPLTVTLALLAAVAWKLDGLRFFVALWRPVFIAAYILIGFAWVFFKWTRLVEEAFKRRDTQPPRWADHSYDFAAYFFYWPVDMIAYLLSDFMQEVWKFVAKMIGRSFDSYATWRFSIRRRD